MAEIRLGTSGWSYAEWVGGFYPSDDVNKLTFYSRIFRTAEIDSTFYSYPSKGLVYGWTKHTHPDFVFSAKLPGLITHEKKLRLEEGVEVKLNKFLELMEPLIARNKLGPILIQLPPHFKKDYELLEAFFRILPKDQKFAIEFRHPSWWREETWKLLSKYEIANTIVDEPLLPSDPIVTTDFSFIRWHGRGKRPWYNYRYSIKELEPWLPKLKEVSDKVKEIYGYFNNHFHGYAVENCLQVLEMLGVITDEQKKMKKHVSDYLETKAKEMITHVAPIPLERDVSSMSFEKLLSSLIPREKLARAKGISDEEIKELKISEGLMEAVIRDYHVLIDENNRIIMHDCADWARCIPDKSFCKHLGKILLIIPKDQATRILRKLLVEKEDWQFKPYVGRAR
ncbi:MAG: DUF72 domain-containing protein [archaeon]|nr:DUF72 domain-containing protein [archaeon]